MRSLATMPVTFAHLGSAPLDMKAIHAAALAALKAINLATGHARPMA